MASFLSWAVVRLWHLAAKGVGLVSLITTVALFVLPTYASGLPRWLAVVPIPAYIILTLLHDEYRRERGACLTAEIERDDRDERFRRTRFVIRNCGPVAIEQVDWETPAEGSGWYLGDDQLERPWPVLDPGEKLSMPLSITIVGDTQITVPLTGVVDGKPYRRDKRISVFS